MLFGKYEHSLDDKKRLAIPAKLRSKLEKKVYVSKGFEGSLELRTEEEFNNWTQEVLSVTTLSKETRALSRHILSNTAEIDVDNAGRILIPANILSLANIEKEVYILGLGTKAEIWDKATYDKYMEETIEDIELLAENLAAKNNSNG